MARRPLAEGLADSLEESIVSGTYPPGGQVPNENDLSRESGLSRATVREAIKILQAKGLVRVAAGKGTFVAPMSEWSLLDPLLLVARSRHESDGSTWTRGLLEARRLVEVGAAGIAASRRSEQVLAELRSLITTMTESAEAGDVVAFVDADIRFHGLILTSTANSFIKALFDPLEQVIRLTRYQTSAHAEVRNHAIDHHEKILNCLAEGDPDAASEAMGQHIDQTEADFLTYVTDPAQSLIDFRAVPAQSPPDTFRSLRPE
jgi:DNA-binding FadR family transcriptional regulator